MPTVVTLQELRRPLESADAAFFISVASTALILYDYLITLDLEVQQIWKREISGATVLFILTRYITLLQRILVAISLSSLHSLDTCNLITWLTAIVTSILVAIMSCIAAVRIFALWNRDYRLLAAVVIAGLFPAATNLYFRSASTALLVPSEIYTCQVVPTAMSAVMYKNLSVATRAISIASDGLVVALTWVKTYRVFILTRRVLFRTNYSTLILRDGTLYFLAVCFLNIVAIIFVLNIGSNLLNDIIVTLSSLLMSRFLLNLRDQRARNETQTFTFATGSIGFSSLPMSSVNFQSELLSHSHEHSMGASMLDDDDDKSLASLDDAPMVVAADADHGLWRCETGASVRTETTCVGSIAPGAKDYEGVLVLEGKEGKWAEV